MRSSRDGRDRPPVERRWDSPATVPGRVLITLVVEPPRFAAGDGDERGQGAAQPQPLLTVEGDAYRHLFRARRIGVGERLRVVDGEGRGGGGGGGPGGG